MEIETVNGKANAGLALGIVGTALSVLSGGLGLFNGHAAMGSGMNNCSGWNNGWNGNHYVTKDELNYVQQLGLKDSQIALLTSEQNTEIKIADVYERLITRINQNQRDQAEWNASQSVANARISAAIATNENSIADLRHTCRELTKIVIPADNVCPRPMPMFNSWTAPAAGAQTTVTETT